MSLKNNLLSFAHDQSRRCRTDFLHSQRTRDALSDHLEFPTVDQQRYDALSATLASSGPPSGILFHSCAAVPHGWRITDLWESATAFDRFVDVSLLPATRALGWPEPSRRECIATYHAGMVHR
ncbi:hypothetical protein ACQKIO_13735 [Pseudomonas sp. NPDC047959]